MERVVITPDTPLEELDEFLETNEGKGGAFALVTDSGTFPLPPLYPDEILTRGS